MPEFGLVLLQVWFARALLVGLFVFALIQYLRHRSGSNVGFAVGSLLIALGMTTEIVLQSFFWTLRTESGISIRFPLTYRVAMVLVIVGCGVCIVTGMVNVLGGRMRRRQE